MLRVISALVVVVVIIMPVLVFITDTCVKKADIAMASIRPPTQRRQCSIQCAITCSVLLISPVSVVHV